MLYLFKDLILILWGEAMHFTDDFKCIPIKFNTNTALH